MHIGVINSIRETFLTIEDGGYFCKETTYQPTPSDFAAVIQTPGVGLPAEYFYSEFSIWGVLTPSLCQAQIDGIPSQNIPVLSLTETTTIMAQLQGLSTTAKHTEPSSIRISVSAVLPQETSFTLSSPTMTRLNQPTIATKPLPVTLTPPSDSTNPDSTEPDSTEPDSTNPDSTNPDLRNPDSTDPDSTNPDSTKPDTPPSDLTNPLNAVPSRSSNPASHDPLTGGERSVTPSSVDPLKPAAKMSSLQPQPLLAAQAVTVAGEVFTRDSASRYVFGSTTLNAGAPGITVDGTVVSLGSSAGAPGLFLFTTPLVPMPTEPPNRFTADGFTINRDSISNFVIGDQTATAGAAVITVSGVPFRALTSGTAIVLGESTIPVPADTKTLTPDIFTKLQDLAALSRGPNAELVIGTQTLTPGAPAITMSGVPISLPAWGTAIVVGESTLPVPDNLAGSPTILELDGHSFTETSGSGFVIASQTLLPGGSAITVNGTLISLAPSATALQIGSSTEALTTSQGLGEVIMSGFFSGMPGRAGPTNGTSFTGSASRSFGKEEGNCRWMLQRIGIVFGFVVCIFVATL
ncbi:MAG: hypothetical protein Q9213_004037 [Squamulea squamosa]